MARWATAAAVVLLLASSWCAYGEGVRPRQRRRFVGGQKWRSGGKGGRPLEQPTAYSFDWEERWYEQTLDHFSARTDTFQQKYLFAPQWWSGPGSGAPIFVYCGNEGNIEWFAENSGFVWEIAPLFGALVLFPEHRYYGESMPFGSMEAAYKDADSLTYLNSEQALADFVVLLTDLKKNLSAEASPIVLFGGSYGGMLAAWFRMKYPHIAIGAIAFSAPILQFEGLASPYTFDDTVSKDFKEVSEPCFQSIRNSWKTITDVGSTKDGLKELTAQFGICSDLQSSSDLADWIMAAYDYVAMANYPYPANFVQDLPGYPIKEMCTVIDEVGGGENGLAGIAAAMNVYYNYSGALSCFDLTADPHGLSGWDWQACTEMVMPASTRNSSMFPAYEWGIGDFEDWCVQNYKVKPRPNWVTEEYGGQDIGTVLKHSGSNIVFSNGLVDPWSGGGVLEDISESIVALVTEKGAHHLDLRSSTPDDPDWLTEQRKIEVAHIQRWLNEYSASRGLFVQ